MKLLTPTQVGEAREQDTRRNVVRAQEVESAVIRVQKKLAVVTEEFDETLKAMNERWEKATRQHEADVKAQRAEIEGLEKRREQALIPISIEADRLEAKRAEIADEAGAARSLQEYAEGLTTLLEDKLSAVGEREDDVAEREKKVAARELGAAEQAEAVSAAARKLEATTRDWLARMSGEEADLNERKKNVTLTEISQAAQAERNAMDAEENQKERKRLQDLAATLERSQKRTLPGNKEP